MREDGIAEACVFGLVDTPDMSWRMRLDETRAFVYQYWSDSAVVDRGGLVHPTEAILLALIDGTPFGGAVEKVSYLFDCDQAMATEMLSQLVRKWGAEGALVEIPEQRASRYRPETFAVPAGSIDLTTPWLFRPISMQFKLSERCVRNCRYCNVERRRDLKEMQTARWLELVDESIDIGVEAFTLTGGDPLLHPGCLAIVHHLCERGIQPAVSTKTYVDEPLADKIAETGIRWFQVSMDGTEAVEDYLTGSQGAFSQLLQSIQNLVARGIKVRTNTVITPYNVFCFPDLVRLMTSIGVEKMRTSQFGTSLFSEESKSFELPPVAAKWLESKCGEMRADGIDVHFEGVYPDLLRENFAVRAACSAGRRGLIISPIGGVSLCDQLPNDSRFEVGCVASGTIMEVWNGAGIQRFRQPSRQQFDGTCCAECSEFDECAGKRGICFRESYKAYGRIFGPSPFCPMAAPAVETTAAAAVR